MQVLPGTLGPPSGGWQTHGSHGKARTWDEVPAGPEVDRSFPVALGGPGHHAHPWAELGGRHDYGRGRVGRTLAEVSSVPSGSVCKLWYCGPWDWLSGGPHVTCWLEDQVPS